MLLLLLLLLLLWWLFPDPCPTGLQVNNVEKSQDAPTLVLSEKSGGQLNDSANSVTSYSLEHVLRASGPPGAPDHYAPQ